MADHSHTDTCGNICFCQFISFISKVNTGHASDSIFFIYMLLINTVFVVYTMQINDIPVFKTMTEVEIFLAFIGNS